MIDDFVVLDSIHGKFIVITEAGYNSFNDTGILEAAQPPEVIFDNFLTKVQG
jgi:hypothetical protein